MSYLKEFLELLSVIWTDWMDPNRSLHSLRVKIFEFLKYININVKIFGGTDLIEEEYSKLIQKVVPHKHIFDFVFVFT